MTGVSLERVARRVAAGRQTLPRRRRRGGSRTLVDVPSAERAPERHYSRGAALKLAAVGAVSVSLGSWRAGPAQAQQLSKSGCVAGCLDAYERDLAKRVDGCIDRYAAPYFNSPGWSRFLRSFDRFLPGIDYVVSGGLAEVCMEGARAVEVANRERCLSKCEKNCQAAASAACAVVPPPKAPPPPPVPPPAPDDPCAACNEVGGYCCGTCPGQDYAPCLTVLTDGTLAGTCESQCG